MPGRELTLVTEGSIELLGLIPRSSNQTFLVHFWANIRQC